MTSINNAGDDNFLSVNSKAGKSVLFDKAHALEFQSVIKVRNFGGEDTGVDEDPDEIWSFPIGWNRKIDPTTGLANEPIDLRFLSNSIMTAKYTCLNFVPFNLCFQLSKGPNIYYLFMSVLQMIPAITNSGGSPTNMPPLVGLMIVSMVKDFLEDKRRRAGDEQENNRLSVLVEPNHSSLSVNKNKQNQLSEPLMDDSSTYQHVPWKHLKIG